MPSEVKLGYWFYELAGPLWAGNLMFGDKGEQELVILNGEIPDDFDGHPIIYGFTQNEAFSLLGLHQHTRSFNFGVVNGSTQSY